MKKTAIVLFSVLTAILLLLMLFAFLFINENRVATLLEKQLGDRYSVEINSTAFNLFSRTLRLGGVTVELESDSTVFESGSLIVKHIEIMELIRGNFAADEVELNDFTLNLRLLQQEHFTESDTTETDSRRKGIISLDSVDLRNGNLLFADERGGSGEINGMNVHGENVTFNPECEECSPLSSVQGLNISIPDLSYDLPDRRYRLHVRGVMLNEEERRLIVQQVNLSPLLSQEDYFQSLEYRTDLYEISILNTSIHDLDYRSLREQRAFHARKLSVDSLDIHVTLDKRVEENPDPDKKMMPPTALENLPFQMALDSLTLDNADILYSEIDENGVRPGTVTFADSRAVITNISTQSDQPVTVHAHSHLEGVGELDTHMTMYAESGESRMDVSGSLGQFEMNRFNNILVNLEGIRITGGLIEHLEFYITMNDEYSEGEVKMDYSDLSMEIVDRVDNNQNLGDQILGRLVNEFVVRGSDGNDSDGAGIGEISAERDPGKSFFNYLWISLRSGIMDIIRRI